MLSKRLSDSRLLRVGMPLVFCCSIGVSSTCRALAASFSQQPVLPGTDDIDASAEPPFSISPDGRWLFYVSYQSTVAEPRFKVYDLASGTSRAVILDENAATRAQKRHGPLQEVGCWWEDSQRVLIPGGNDTYQVEVAASVPVLSISELSEAQSRDFFAKCAQDRSRGHSQLKIIQHSPRHAAIVSPSDRDRIVASYKATWLLRTDVRIDHLVESPNGGRAAYLVTMYTGSFVGSSTAYVVDVAASAASEPRLVSKGVYGPLVWSADGGSLLGVASLPDGAGQSVYRWKLDQR